MGKVLKLIGIVFLLLIGVVAIAGVILSFVGAGKLSETAEVEAEAIDIPIDDASIERGEHLVQSVCVSCHGPTIEGEPLINDPAIGTIYAPNLTGLAQTHTDGELVLAIRHAVGHDGRKLMIMPAESFIHFSAEDLGAIIAYLKSVPASGEESPEPSLGIMGRILLAAGMFGQIFPADVIDHDTPFTDMPAIGANQAYGEYLSGLCRACHGPDLKGAVTSDPESPPAPDITSAGSQGSWTEAEFLHMMRTGITPDNRAIDANYMPWASFGKLYDEELQALWLYLQEQ